MQVTEIIMKFCCRTSFWYWESVVLIQTLGLAAAQVFANALDAFYQLTIMLVILLVGTVALAYLHPFDQDAPQLMQVHQFHITCMTLQHGTWCHYNVTVSICIFLLHDQV